MTARRAVVVVLALAVLAGVLAGGGAGAAPTGHSVRYRPPVDAPVVAPFRAPAGPYGPGHRGVDLGTSAGVAVHVAAAGTVTFAGRVAGGLHVTVAHADGVRTTYSFLRVVRVRAGQRLADGAVVGTTGGILHVGARRGSTYVDPVLLWSGPPRVWLVPLDGGGGEFGPARAARYTRSSAR